MSAMLLRVNLSNTNGLSAARLQKRASCLEPACPHAVRQPSGRAQRSSHAA